MSILADHFPIQLQLRIDWSEIDLFGHVNNVMYFKYIQASRVNYWETIHLTDRLDKDKIGPILASTQCQFIKPLHYPGNITIQAGISFIKNTSFGIHHQILNEQQERAAEAHDVVVMYDFNKNEKIPFPAELRNAIETLQGKTF
ncbi:MAG: acyl-CoA thioesterase [Bacteroidota bacterium]